MTTEEITEQLAGELFGKGFTHRSRDVVARWVIELGYRKPETSIVAPNSRAHDHPPYRPVCNERIVDGQLRGACLNDDGTSVTSSAEGDAS